jgi:hypothetical protein
MSRTVLVTVADDRFGRKNSKYSETQHKIEHIMRYNPQLGIHEMKMWKWENIEATDFYKQNKTLLDNTDAARNGRAYKPYIIWEALSSLSEGDYVIYTDCSPEMWEMDWNTPLPYAQFNLEVIHNLTKANDDILVTFVKWDDKDIPAGQLGKHTHRHFTLNRCMDKMGLRQYEDSFMNASGMWCIRKTESTLKFAEEWLHWNTDEDCCSLGKISIEDDYSFWEAECHEVSGKDGYKMGHRHDQSIAGLLLNKRNAKFVDILYNDMSPYNFLQYMRTGVNFKFIPGNPSQELDLPIKVGDTVKNEKGVILKVLRIEEGKYVIGKSTGSAYITDLKNLTKIDD